MLEKDQRIIDLITKNKTIQEIKEEENLENYELLEILHKIIYRKTYEKLSNNMEYNLNKMYLENLHFLKVQNTKIILISDTHLASKEENLLYLEEVADFIKQNKIPYLLHGGDIGDGMISYNENYYTYQKQIEHILEVYPEFSDTEQFLLAGNHDRKYWKKGLDVLSLLTHEKKKITGIGYYQSYFKIYDKTISFEHHSKWKKINLVTPKFTISGHTHQYRAKEDHLTLPTLSDSNPNGKEDLNPGFVLLTTSKKEQDINLFFEYYHTTENGIRKNLEKSYTLK